MSLDLYKDSEICLEDYLEQGELWSPKERGSRIKRDEIYRISIQAYGKETRDAGQIISYNQDTDDMKRYGFVVNLNEKS